MKEFDDKTYHTRDKNGNIITQPKNFLTNPYKKGFGNTTVGHLFGPVKYVQDPYNRPKEFDIQERAIHKSKILNLSKPFVSTSKNKNLFSSNLEVFGSQMQPDARRRSFNYPGVSHSKPFKPGNPAKQGYNKTLSKFPDYVEEGEQKKKKKKIQINYPWRPNSQGTYARPNPCISIIALNLHKSGRIFR